MAGAIANFGSGEFPGSVDTDGIGRGGASSNAADPITSPDVFVLNSSAPAAKVALGIACKADSSGDNNGGAKIERRGEGELALREPSLAALGLAHTPTGGGDKWLSSLLCRLYG